MSNLMFAAELKIRTLANKFLRDEKGDVNIVTIVVLIGVAVCLAIIFKEEITKLLQHLMQSITTNADSAIKPK